jgi:glutamate/tyrosine decarboxylase-like PLP-dependent enzyme
MAKHMADEPLVRVVNDVELNQVLLDVAPADVPAPQANVFVETVINAVRDDGACWIGGTTWRGRPMIRFSVANYLTSEEDIDVSAAAIARAVAAAADELPNSSVPWQRPA